MEDALNSIGATEQPLQETTSSSREQLSAGSDNPVDVAGGDGAVLTPSLDAQATTTIACSGCEAERDDGPEQENEYAAFVIQNWWRCNRALVNDAALQDVASFVPQPSMLHATASLLGGGGSVGGSFAQGWYAYKGLLTPVGSIVLPRSTHADHARSGALFHVPENSNSKATPTRTSGGADAQPTGFMANMAASIIQATMRRRIAKRQAEVEVAAMRAEQLRKRAAAQYAPRTPVTVAADGDNAAAGTADDVAQQSQNGLLSEEGSPVHTVTPPRTPSNVDFFSAPFGFQCNVAAAMIQTVWRRRAETATERQHLQEQRLRNHQATGRLSSPPIGLSSPSEAGHVTAAGEPEEGATTGEDAHIERQHAAKAIQRCYRSNNAAAKMVVEEAMLTVLAMKEARLNPANAPPSADADAEHAVASPPDPVGQQPVDASLAPSQEAEPEGGSIGGALFSACPTAAVVPSSAKPPLGPQGNGKPAGGNNNGNRPANTDGHANDPSVLPDDSNGTPTQRPPSVLFSFRPRGYAGVGGHRRPKRDGMSRVFLCAHDEEEGDHQRAQLPQTWGRGGGSGTSLPQSSSTTTATTATSKQKSSSTTTAAAGTSSGSPRNARGSPTRSSGSSSPPPPPTAAAPPPPRVFSGLRAMHDVMWDVLREIPLDQLETEATADLGGAKGSDAAGPRTDGGCEISPMPPTPIPCAWTVLCAPADGSDSASAGAGDVHDLMCDLRRGFVVVRWRRHGPPPPPPPPPAKPQQPSRAAVPAAPGPTPASPTQQQLYATERMVADVLAIPGEANLQSHVDRYHRRHSEDTKRLKQQRREFRTARREELERLHGPSPTHDGATPEDRRRALDAFDRAYDENDELQRGHRTGEGGHVAEVPRSLPRQTDDLSAQVQAIYGEDWQYRTIVPRAAPVEQRHHSNGRTRQDVVPAADLEAVVRTSFEALNALNQRIAQRSEQLRMSVRARNQSVKQRLAMLETLSAHHHQPDAIPSPSPQPNHTSGTVGASSTKHRTRRLQQQQCPTLAFIEASRMATTVNIESPTRRHRNNDGGGAVSAPPNLPEAGDDGSRTMQDTITDSVGGGASGPNDDVNQMLRQPPPPPRAASTLAAHPTATATQVSKTTHVPINSFQLFRGVGGGASSRLPQGGKLPPLPSAAPQQPFSSPMPTRSVSRNKSNGGGSAAMDDDTLLQHFLSEDECADDERRAQLERRLMREEYFSSICRRHDRLEKLGGVQEGMVRRHPGWLVKGARLLPLHVGNKPSPLHAKKK